MYKVKIFDFIKKKNSSIKRNNYNILLKIKIIILFYKLNNFSKINDLI